MEEITKTEIYYFNDFISREYKEKEIINLINQLKDNKNASKEIICKYWMRIYTLQSNFFINANEKLRQKKGEFYYPFIKMCYEMIKKKILTPVINKKLYRGSMISLKEYENIKNLIENKKNKEFPKIITYARSFLSFSEDEKTAYKILVRQNLITNLLMFFI